MTLKHLKVGLHKIFKQNLYTEEVEMVIRERNLKNSALTKDQL